MEHFVSINLSVLVLEWQCLSDAHVKWKAALYTSQMQRLHFFVYNSSNLILKSILTISGVIHSPLQILSLICQILLSPDVGSIQIAEMVYTIYQVDCVQSQDTTLRIQQKEIMGEHVVISGDPIQNHWFLLLIWPLMVDTLALSRILVAISTRTNLALSTIQE